MFDPSLKLCDSGACCVWVLCSPSSHRMEYEREREDEEDDSNEFIRNKEDVATQRNDRRGKHHMVESCEETPPTGTTFKQRTASTATEPSESRGNHLDKHLKTNTPRRYDLTATPPRPDH